MQCCAVLPPAAQLHMPMLALPRTYGFTAPLQAFLGAHFGYRQSLIASQLRSAVTAAVFQKALAVDAATLAATGSGRVQVGTEARIHAVIKTRAAHVCSG